jgi:hypothetical protein
MTAESFWSEGTPAAAVAELAFEPVKSRRVHLRVAPYTSPSIPPELWPLVDGEPAEENRLTVPGPTTPNSGQ